MGSTLHLPPWSGRALAASHCAPPGSAPKLSLCGVHPLLNILNILILVLTLSALLLNLLYLSIYHQHNKAKHRTSILAIFLTALYGLLAQLLVTLDFV